MIRFLHTEGTKKYLSTTVTGKLILDCYLHKYTDSNLTTFLHHISYIYKSHIMTSPAHINYTHHTYSYLRPRC